MSKSITFPSTSPVIHGNLSFNASGDNTLVAGVANQTIRVLKIVLGVAAGSSVTAALWDGPSATGTARGTFYLGTLVLDFEANPLIIAAGNGLVCNLTSGVTVKGLVSYVQQATQE